MFSALKLVAAAATVAVVGGLLVVSGVTVPQNDLVVPAAVTASPSPTPTEGSQDFPTGTFAATDRADLVLVFNEDGSGRVVIQPDAFEVLFTYAVQGDLWTEMIHDSLGDRQVPATYYWDYDGEILSFEGWGEELNPSSRGTAMGYDYRLIPDAREVLLTTAAIEAGEPIQSSSVARRIVPGSEAGPDAFTDRSEVKDRIAAVTIEAGQPITPDLLEPPAE